MKGPRKHPALTRLRKLVKSLPETQELETWDHPTFRVREKIFASFGEHEGRPIIGCKQTKPDQAALVQDPRFFVAPYVGKHGWVGIYVDEVEWPFIADHVEQSFCLIAPAKLVRTFQEGDAAPATRKKSKTSGAGSRSKARSSSTKTSSTRSQKVRAPRKSTTPRKSGPRGTAKATQPAKRRGGKSKTRRSS